MRKDARKVAEARRLRKEGKALKDIAAAIDVCVATASLYCKGVMPKGSVRPDPRRQQVWEQVEAWYREGIPISEISKRLGIPAPTLYDWRRQSGLKKNKRSAYVTDELRDRIRRKMTIDPDGKLRKQAVRLYVEKELATTEIAEKLGVTAVTVGTWLEQEGIDRRQSPTRRTREKLREANLGEKRYNWKGGITAERMQHRRSMYMRDARTACFERDDYTCRSCNQRGGKLNAHHVWPFQRYPDWKYEVWNLVTLCKSCHDDWHKAAGGHVKVAIGPFYAGLSHNELRGK